MTWDNQPIKMVESTSLGSWDLWSCDRKWWDSWYCDRKSRDWPQDSWSGRRCHKTGHETSVPMETGHKTDHETQRVWIRLS